jgi:hypothetical protein
MPIFLKNSYNFFSTGNLKKNNVHLALAMAWIILVRKGKRDVLPMRKV